MIVEVGAEYVGKGVGVRVVDQVLLPEEEVADCVEVDDKVELCFTEVPVVTDVGFEVVLMLARDEELAGVPMLVPEDDVVDCLKADDDDCDRVVLWLAEVPRVTDVGFRLVLMLTHDEELAGVPAPVPEDGLVGEDEGDDNLLDKEVPVDDLEIGVLEKRKPLEVDDKPAEGVPVEIDPKGGVIKATAEEDILADELGLTLKE